ncbi:MAG TPA: type II toxin-antitoxin system PemK/MazF family toxin [Novosphingobium sp.]|nr:type II toxin-antitoxin system PemK/MazF family toxin [Novosphingobium sp.]
MSLLPKRGEIWLTRLDPTEGNELRKTRPCLVVTPDTMNRILGTVTVMPITSGSRPMPFRISTDFRGIPGLLLGDQIRSVAKSRLLKRLDLADEKTLADALAVLRDMFEE